jgi:uncharacterized protein YidB (DUF937 family)
MELLQDHPGGIRAIMDALNRNGLSQHVAAWTSGGSAEATTAQVEQGLSGTGLLEKMAASLGISPQVAGTVVAAMLPAVVAHLAPGGQEPAPNEFAGLAQQFLGKIR